MALGAARGGCAIEIANAVEHNAPSGIAAIASTSELVELGIIPAAPCRAKFEDAALTVVICPVQIAGRIPGQGVAV